MRETVLVIAPNLRDGQRQHSLSRMSQFQVVTTYNVQEALHWISQSRKPDPDAILMEVPLGEETAALAGMQEILHFRSNLPIVILLQYGQDIQGMEFIKAGCIDFLCLPITSGRMRLTLQNLLKLKRMGQYIAWLERKVAGHVDVDDMVGQNCEFKESLSLARHAASSSIPVWVEGETGTGKAVLARSIHGSSDRAGKPFVAVNCEMLPAHLVREVLFGQDYTASVERVQFVLGKIREAEQGTLLLQEVGALQADLRWQLVEMLRTGMFTPVGSSASLPVHARVIFTNSNNEKYRAERDDFEQKLIQHFPIQKISLPSLACRRDDIALLANHFLLIHATSENKYVSGITDRAIEWLEQCHWPNNVGELSHVIWRAVLLTERDVIDVQELKMVQKHRMLYLYSNNQDRAMTDSDGRVKTLRSMEQEAIRFALQQSNGCMTRAAKSLGIGRSTLYRKVQEFNIAAQG